MNHSLVDHGYPTFKKIVVGRNVVGYVHKRESDYEGIIESVRKRARTEGEAFRAVVAAVGGSIGEEPRLHVSGGRASRPRMRTHAIAEEALDMLIVDYRAGLAPTTYGDLVERLGADKRNDARWFGGVCQLIDAACVLKGLPSFGLARIREAGGAINSAAWPKAPELLRVRIFENAERGSWSDDDFAKIKEGLADLSARGLGPQKAAEYVTTLVDPETWAAATVPEADAA